MFDVVPIIVPVIAPDIVPIPDIIPVPDTVPIPDIVLIPDTIPIPDIILIPNHDLGAKLALVLTSLKSGKGLRSAQTTTPSRP